jgi:hypothetical protein
VDFTAGQTNADILAVETVLFNATYSFDVADAFNLFGNGSAGDWGRFSLAMNGQRTISREDVVAGVLVDNTVGEPFDPRWSGTNDFTYTNGGLRLFWRILWTDRIDFDAAGENFFADADDNIISTVGGRVLHNASISYDLSEALSNYDNPLTLQLNVNNVLGRTAAFGNQRAFNNRGFAENFGRSFLLTLRAQF